MEPGAGGDSCREPMDRRAAFKRDERQRKDTKDEHSNRNAAGPRADAANLR